MKKLFSLILSLAMVFSLAVPAFAAETPPSTPEDTIIVTQKIYFNEMTPLSPENSQDTEFRTGPRPKKWVVYDVKVTNSEWTDFSKKLGVFKSQNGSTITGTVTASVNSSFTANVSVPSSAVTVGVGYNVSTGFSVTGSSTAEIPEGHKLASARAYPIYEVSSFKAKKVYIYGHQVFERGEGTAYKPVGAEVVFEFKRA